MDMYKMTNARACIFLASFVLVVVAPFAMGQAISPLTSDFGIDVTSADNLTFTGFRDLATPPKGEFNITFAFLSEYPALAGQGVAGALLQFGPYSINAVHNHPRGSEVLFLLSGSIIAGLVDTSNQLFIKTLYPGDAFLFPVGLTHFQLNNNSEPATALSAFGSSNSGRTSIPPNLFNSNPRIPIDILEESFDLDAETIERLYNIPFPANG